MNNTETIQKPEVQQNTVNSMINKIKQLHSEIIGSCTDTVEKGIELGGILKAQRKTLKHGQWNPFIDENFDFCTRTATNYIKVYAERDYIRSLKIKDLATAYKVLSNPQNFRRHELREETKKRRKEFANQITKFENQNSYINTVLCGDNLDVMKRMIDDGMAGKYTAVLSSPPYNALFEYGNGYNDDKPYNDYLEELASRFPLYCQLLRVGGRVIYVVPSIVKNKNRENGGDYNYPLVSDLIYEVKKVAPDLLRFNNIIWDKSSRKNPLNQDFGTFCDPKRPLTRSCHEHILVFSYKQFDLENIEGTESDITADEFKEAAWSQWKISPYSRSNNHHPCSFPPKLIERALKFFTNPKDLILDPYAGVSTTAQVCQKLNRRYTMIEQNPNYCKESERLLKSA